MVPVEKSPWTIFIHDVPVYVSVNSIAYPPGFLSLKGRFVGQAQRSQLLGTVQGAIPTEV